MSAPARSAADVVQFWTDAGPEKWFAKDDAFDAKFRDQLGALHDKAASGGLDDWRNSAEGALGLLILLDQFPRNVFRGTTRVYATDPKAREIARGALDAGFDMQVDRDLRVFFYLPFSHSEDMADQEIALAKNKVLGAPYLEHAQGHHDIVQRFGRFPHRNVIFGRQTTAEEQKFLDEGGFKG